MGKLRWKMEPREAGLRAVGAGPRGHVYHDGEKLYAVVYALGGSWAMPQRGWYWVAGWESDVPYKNTCDKPVATADEAKAAAAAYVREHLTAN